MVMTPTLLFPVAAGHLDLPNARRRAIRRLGSFLDHRENGRRVRCRTARMRNRTRHMGVDPRPDSTRLQEAADFCPRFSQARSWKRHGARTCLPYLVVATRWALLSVDHESRSSCTGFLVHQGSLIVFRACAFAKDDCCRREKRRELFAPSTSSLSLAT